MEERVPGHMGPDGWVFGLYAENLALNLVNTLSDRPSDSPIERLVTYSDLVRWGVQAGAIRATQARKLRVLAEKQPRAATLALQRAVRCREAISQIAAALASGEVPPSGALQQLNRELPAAFGGARLVWGEDPPLRFERDEPELDEILHAVLRSFAELAADADRVARIRMCGDATCRWVFLDTTKNRTRRWCDMAVCGNRAKARRHAERAREG